MIPVSVRTIRRITNAYWHILGVLLLGTLLTACIGDASTSSSGSSPSSATATPAPTPTPAPTSYTLTVNKIGSGTVSSSLAGINCGGACSAAFANNSVVTLTATPASGYSFSGWGGVCSGATCGVTMSTNQAVTATFTAVTATGTAQLLWDAPTTNTDGSAPVDVAGYIVSYGTVSGNYTQSTTLPLVVLTCTGAAPVTCGYTVTGLTANTWYFAVQAYDGSNNASTYSNEAFKTIP